MYYYRQDSVLEAFYMCDYPQDSVLEVFYIYDYGQDSVLTVLHNPVLNILQICFFISWQP